MGTYLSTPRLPLSWAVDLLTGRREIVDLKRGQSERMEGAYTFWLDDPPEVAPYSLDFSKFYKRAIDAMTGTLHDRFAREFRHDEPDDPRFWSIYGARRVGWEEDDLMREAGYIFPFRYSLPEDIWAIVDQLESMTEEDLRRNVEQVIEASDDRYASEVAQRWMREQAAVKLLPTLRQFYEAAQKEGDVVVYWLG